MLNVSYLGEFVFSRCLIGVGCITEHPKFGIVCLDTDVSSTALVAIHNARLNPIPDPIGRQVNCLFLSYFVRVIKSIAFVNLYPLVLVLGLGVWQPTDSLLGGHMEY